MKITDSLYVLPISVNFTGNPSIYNHSLILDSRQGPTLVDAGAPVEVLEAALDEADVKLADLRRLILTHQDPDHIASAAAVVRASGAKVLAHAADAPYMDGTRKWLKMPPPEVLATFPEAMRAFIERGFEPVKVDQFLQDGQVLDLAGGVRVVATPGHTPGHISLYLQKDKALIAGDALTAQDGKVRPPTVQGTPDMPEAMRSVAKLAELDIQTLVAFHGGVVQGDVQGQLCELTKELSS